MKANSTYRIALNGVVACLLLFSSQLMAQRTRAQIQAEVAAYQELSDKLMRVFLNPQAPEVRRLAAADTLVIVTNQELIPRVLATFRNTKESDTIRSRALGLLDPQLVRDDRLASEVVDLLGDVEQSPTLRRASMKAVSLAAVAAPAMIQDAEKTFDVLRTVAQDKDLTIRRGALRILCAFGDDYAQQLLIDGLKEENADLLPDYEAVNLIGLDSHTDYYPDLLKIMQSTKDSRTRLACVNILGPYSEAQPVILGYLNDANADLILRRAALVSTQANQPASFSEITAGLVGDDSAPDALRIMAIQTVMYQRRSPRVRPRNEGELDQFDQNVRSLRSRAKSEALGKVVEDYINRLKIDF
ncbi:MAG: hypothetical protein AAF998_04670 [Bacteroidota bacterium]